MLSKNRKGTEQILHHLPLENQVYQDAAQDAKRNVHLDTIAVRNSVLSIMGTSFFLSICFFHFTSSSPALESHLSREQMCSRARASINKDALGVT